MGVYQKPYHVISYWEAIWNHIKKSWVACLALSIFLIFLLIGIYAPILASSKPLVVVWQGRVYFPLLRYLFFPGYYTKPIDLFYNLLMLILPLGVVGCFLLRKHKGLILILCCLTQVILFGCLLLKGIKDPVYSPAFAQLLGQMHKKNAEDLPLANTVKWHTELAHLPPYAKLNLILRYNQRKNQHAQLAVYLKEMPTAPTLWQMEHDHQEAKKKLLLSMVKEKQAAFRQALSNYSQLVKKQSITEVPESILNTLTAYKNVQNELFQFHEKESWLREESSHLRVVIPPLIRPFHWEEDAGGSQEMNRLLPWWERTRVNRKDLVAGLIFGVRISLVVGISAVVLALVIGVPLGTIAGYFAGKTDMAICRLIEIWEAMPTFFTLLVVIAVTQSKSILLIVTVIGIFGWTGFGRFIRGEVLKQRNLAYVMACRSMGYNHVRIMFRHIMPNAIPPILTLFPFSMMAAIISEASLSFLGLGEEGSTSWGVLMDEGRSVFPGESYLLWPPAILLTVLLISIALVGDALRDALDPKLR